MSRNIESRFAEVEARIRDLVIQGRRDVQRLQDLMGHGTFEAETGESNDIISMLLYFTHGLFGKWKNKQINK